MNLEVTIEFLSYWHAGSGLGKGALADSLVILDKENLPYLPGKTLKGLFRESFSTMVDAEFITEKQLQLSFGAPSDEKSDNVESGCLAFSDAYIENEFRNWLLNNEDPLARECIFETLTNTRLNSEGVAENKTLRSIEVCVPMVLKSRISLIKPVDDEEKLEKHLLKGAGLIRQLGSQRKRGLGRCKIQMKKLNN